MSHRASHVPPRPLPLRNPGSAGSVGGSGGGSAGATFPPSSRSHDNLSALQKTTSYPPSPASPVSPVETEFSGTPIDASFGERIDGPIKTIVVGANDRAGLPSQSSRSRSRSATLTQLDPAGKKAPAVTMDKYARQAGDDAYESEGADADDEFERTVFSPTVPTHFDENESHPSESEDEEHDSLEGEDTPTTQGWGDREGRSPTGSIAQWTEEQVGDFIASLDPAMKKYSQKFEDEGINGDALVALQQTELRELGVASLGHRLTILKAVYEQKLRAGVKIEEDDYVPPSAEGDKADLTATQDDIARIIEALKLRDQRVYAAEAELQKMRHDLDRILEEHRKLREETLPVLRLLKDQRTPLPDPSGGTIPSPRDLEAPKLHDTLAPMKAESKGSSLSRKFSTKKLFLGGAPKQPSPTHPPQSYMPPPREVRDDPGGAQLEASAAAMAASSHLTASMSSQISPQSVVHSPTSPAYSTQAPSSGGSYHQPGSAAPAQRSFPRDGGRQYGGGHEDGHRDDRGQWSQASTLVGGGSIETATTVRRRQAPMPSPREDEMPRERDRDRDR